MSTHFSRSKGMALCGGSMGGALVAYSVKGILQQMPKSQSQEHPDFYGIALLAPALGVSPQAIPPAPIVMALKTLSYLLPSQGILTPIEHPTYACPPSSTRNFAGRWPLSTSNMLLDLTSHRVPEDVKSNNVQNQMEGLPALCIIAGDKDYIVPISSITQWYEAVTNLSSEKGEKKLIVLEGADHGFFHEGGSHKSAKKNVFAEKLFDWLNDLTSKDFE